MTMFVFAALTVTAFIWAITEPQTPQDLTADEINQLVVLGFVPYHKGSSVSPLRPSPSRLFLHRWHKSYDKAVDYPAKAQIPPSHHRNGCGRTKRSPRKTRAPDFRREDREDHAFCCRRRPQSWHRFCLRCPGPGRRLRLPRLHHAGFRLRGCPDFGADHPGDGAEWPRSPHLRHSFAEPGHLAFPAQSGGWR